MALFRGAPCSRIVRRRTFQIFKPAICGQAKEFAMDKRAEMRRAALPKPAGTY
jgi:hypothetical protein